MLTLSRRGDFDDLPADADLKVYQRLFVRRIIAGAAPRRPRVLEIGPGPSRDLVDFVDAAEYWVVDPAPAWSAPNVRIVPGLVESAPIPRGRFDVVCSVSVLEHVPHERWPAVAEAVRAALRPGGLAVHCIDAKCQGRPDDHYEQMLLWKEFFLNAGLRFLYPDPPIPGSAAVLADPGVWSMSEAGWRRWWASPGERWEDVGRPVSLNLVLRRARLCPRRHLYQLNRWLQRRGLPILA